MIYLKLFLEDSKVKSWIEAEHIKVSSILMILKKNLGYKNRVDIITKTGLDPSFLRTKLCWRTDQEYSEMCQVLNGIVGYFLSTVIRPPGYFGGRDLLDFVEKNGKLEFVPYYRALEGGEKSLIYWTLEKTIERWIKEKF